jgi:DNA-binding winged helix-turn-helix (wHTH) protein
VGTTRFGDFTFDSEMRLLSRSGEPVHLTPKAFDLLHALVDASPRAVRKEELRDRLWPDVVVDESNLKSLVREVRAALGERGRMIRTVHRYGYAFGDAAASTATPARLAHGERVYRLATGVNTIGRDESCAVVLDFTGVSRQHARITAEAARYVLEDLGSKNGTWRNEERVSGAVSLADGDVIRFGALSLTFRSRARAATTRTVPFGG